MIPSPAPTPAIATPAPTTSPPPVVSPSPTAQGFWDDMHTAGFWASTLLALVSVAIAIVALIAAGRGERRAIDRLTAERRRVFELEVLRSLGEQLEEQARPGDLGSWRTRLRMLHGVEELPTWRLMDAGDHPDRDAENAAIRREQEAETRVSGMPVRRHPDELQFREKPLLRSELLAAIERRMTREQPKRRWWRRARPRNF